MSVGVSFSSIFNDIHVNFSVDNLLNKLQLIYFHCGLVLAGGTCKLEGKSPKKVPNSTKDGPHKIY